MLRLYDYWRSSAAYRVRIALNLKTLRYQSIPVDLAAGEQAAQEHHDRNPQGLVPVLEHDGRRITQSLAIIDYLERVFPPPCLLPADPVDRSRAYAMALIVACDVHPLNNLRVLKYLGTQLGASDEDRKHWYHHWLRQGFGALEQLLESPGRGRFCHADQPGLADIFLVPQVYNARRFEFDLGPYPRIVDIEQRCLELDAFHQAAPEQQADAR